MKTASVYVSRILAKLGVRSRTAAAAVALREAVVGETTSASGRAVPQWALSAGATEVHHEVGVSTEVVLEGGGDMSVTEAAGFSTTVRHPQPTIQQQRSLAWLAVAVALAIVVIMILGTMAESRWCGPVVCPDQIETY